METRYNFHLTPPPLGGMGAKKESGNLPPSFFAIHFFLIAGFLTAGAFTCCLAMDAPLSLIGAFGGTGILG